MKQVLKMSAISTALLTLPMMANADVLASVKPLGFITSSIANGVTDTQVLVPAGASPHDYSLKLSDVQKVKSADLVLWDKKDLIAKNLADFNRTLTEQSDKIKAQLAPLKDKGFFVFHDAYSYFNEAYGLNQTGYFTINPLVAPGAKTIAHIKEEIEEHHVNCLFAEPQFTPKVIDSLAQSTKVNVGRLDPIGDNVQLGPNSYANFLQATADSYAQCLTK